MRAEDISRLLAPFVDPPLSGRQLEMVRGYLDLLLRWNERVNLTAVRRPEEIVTRHFGESIFLAQRLFGPEWRGHVADMGSGAGFPGVPIAIYAPNATVTLIESNRKKATFLRELTRALTLPGVSVFPGRAEEFAGHPDVVTLRAVEKFEAAVPVAASLVRGHAQGPGPARRLALLIGAVQEQAAKKLAKGFDWEPPIALPASKNRIILVGKFIGNESSQ